MADIHYGGEGQSAVCHVTDEQAARGFLTLVRAIANAGKYEWIPFADDRGIVTEILVGPGIPIVVTGTTEKNHEARTSTLIRQYASRNVLKIEELPES